MMLAGLPSITGNTTIGGIEYAENSDFEPQKKGGS
jgi:hypothetical protein